MKVGIERKSDTQVVLEVALEQKDLSSIVRHTYNQFRGQVKVAGFRPGRAPDNIVEREIGIEHIHSHVIEDAARKFYILAAKEKDVRPVGQPQMVVKKFVPFDHLEITITTDVIGNIKLPDYKKIHKSKHSIKVKDAEIDQVLESLRNRSAKRSEVKRAAQEGDEVIINMKGTRDGKAVPGTEAKDYGVLIGSGRFVPGFEENIKGLKAEDKKEFSVVFPKDYAEPTLQSKKVTFSIEIKKVMELEQPALDDKFVSSVGPFKNLAELKADIRKQLEIEQEQNRRRQLTDEVVDEVVESTKMLVPPNLIAKQQEHLWSEFEQNVKDQGTTVDDYLKQEKKTKSEIEELLNKNATKRVKTALVLNEVAKAEKLDVTPEELEIRLQVLKGQYTDEKMQEELDKPEAKNDIADQLLMEKTVDKLLVYATQK